MGRKREGCGRKPEKARERYKKSKRNTEREKELQKGRKGDGRWEK